MRSLARLLLFSFLLLALLSCTPLSQPAGLSGTAKPSLPETGPEKPVEKAKELSTATPTSETSPPVKVTSEPLNPTQPPSPVLPTPTQALNYKSALSSDAIARCPVSLPNLVKSPDEYYISSESGFGNLTDTLFIGLWPGGQVYFHPNGPGHVGPDGSLGMKFWFYRTVPGEVVIGGRRLDAPAPSMHETVLRGVADGYGETGFHPAGLLFPSEGCWEVTARAGEEELTFVTLVVVIPYKPFRPGWLPEGFRHTDTDLTDSPALFRYIYRAPDAGAGQLNVETILGAPDNPESYPPALLQPVTVNRSPGVCLQGVQDELGYWQAGQVASVLEWPDGDLTYRISQTGLALRCADLLRIARISP